MKTRMTRLPRLSSIGIRGDAYSEWFVCRHNRRTDTQIRYLVEVLVPLSNTRSSSLGVSLRLLFRCPRWEQRDAHRNKYVISACRVVLSNGSRRSSFPEKVKPRKVVFAF